MSRKLLSHVVFRQDDFNKLYYTGKAGPEYLSPNLNEAFLYEEQGANRKAAMFNRTIGAERFFTEPADKSGN